jgi:cob(I)alamin adenosyltransferase
MIQIYTGDGKGKTTAAVGLAVRAVAHQKVLFVQLLKDGSSSEVEALKKMPKITYQAFGTGEFVNGFDVAQETKVKAGLSYIMSNASEYQVIIIDEAITAVSLGIISEKELLSLVQSISDGKEIIMTGRGASANLVKEADLITEMKAVKHYFDRGIKARKGIEY